MLVNGCACSIVIKTTHREIDIPYSEETLREKIILFYEQASIEGEGMRKAVHKNVGITGCIVTPLTIGTAPLLLYLAMGYAEPPVYVSETRSIYQHKLNIVSKEDTEYFDLIQDRRQQRRFFQKCKTDGFELRFLRDEFIKLKLDILSDYPLSVYTHTDIFPKDTGERFNSDFISYKINGLEYKNIYALTLSVKKDSGIRREIQIGRVLENSFDIPEIIEELEINAKLLRDNYENRHFGKFKVTVKRLILITDETNINSVDTVMGQLRYYVSGSVCGEVFTSAGETIA